MTGARCRSLGSRSRRIVAQVQRLLAWAEPLGEERRWAVESANGLGRLLSQRLVAAGEVVVDVPATLAARVRLLRTVCRLHALLRELIAGGGPQRIRADQAAQLLRTVRPATAVTNERKHMALELLADIR